jgi:diguanylate cyclase (GGDEF)-like protein/PAS domain S-box-containing protein
MEVYSDLHKLYQLIVEQNTDLIGIIDTKGVVLYASPSYYALLGLAPDEFVGTYLLEKIYFEDQPKVKNTFLDKRWKNKVSYRVEFRFLRNGGDVLWVDAKGIPIFKEGKLQHILIVSRDISEQKQYEDKLIRLAYYDTLTGLPNRRLFLDRFEQALLTAKRKDRKLALLYLDVDNFKDINDLHGHFVGDALLEIIASRLSMCIRELDTVCRMGGDEFVILLQEFDETEEISSIAQRMAEVIGQPYLIRERILSISCSIGIAYYPNHSTDGKLLMNYADTAMYRSKASGKGKIVVYAPL